jgi:WD40 repeat protein
VAFSLDGRLLVADGDNLMVWQADIGGPAVLKLAVTGAHSFAFAPDLKSIALASPSLLKGDDAVHLVDLATGKDISKFSVSAALVNCLAFSTDGSILAAATVDGITLWNVSTGKSLIELKGHLGGVTSIVFAVDGTLLASSSTDGTVRLWAVP